MIEILSPGNKRPSSDGRKEYLLKREEIVGSETHLVELDFLRGGLRLPTMDPLPAYDRAGYDYSLDYARALQPPLDDSGLNWVSQILKDRQT